jgi:Pyruvate/2-oxoacid:ferredoxin oxidoreductase delta subunit
LRSNCVVGRDISVDQLRSNVQAVFFAMGLQKAAQLELRPGASGEAATIGVLPDGPPAVPDQELAAVEPRVLNMVSVSIAQGAEVAERIAAHLEKRPVRPDLAPPVIKSDKLKLDWYKALPRFDAAVPTMTEAEAIAEATRCMSCGMCMDCETCWMYCSMNCFVKLPKGEHYKLKLDLCNGCGKCAEACPCGFIEMN